MVKEIEIFQIDAFTNVAFCGNPAGVTFSNNLSIVKFTCETSILSITKKSIENILGHSNLTCSIDIGSIRLWIGSNKVCTFSFFYYYLFI